jgi:hypothetical protein
MPTSGTQDERPRFLKGVLMLEAMRGRLTFANVVAVTALFVALGGTVYAAGKINGTTIKRNSIPGNRLKIGGVTGTQIKESTLGLVPSATHADNAIHADSATHADNATHAANATDAANAQPIAFAHVNANGTLDAASSKNVGTVIRGSQGVYCFGGLPFTPRGGQATMDAFGTGATTQFGIGVGCNPGFADQAFVDTFDGTGSLVDAPFYVVFYG